MAVSGSRLIARDISPDSVIFTVEPNFSIFSSNSASVERCSFASDALDQDSITFQHFSGHELAEVSSGPDPDPDLDPENLILVHKNSGISLSEREKAKDSAENTENEHIALDSRRSSFSRALKDCQDRRLRCEVLMKSDHRRPSSLDLNDCGINAVNSSPRFGVMKKPYGAMRRIDAFSSPGIQKGWSSEHVPLHSNANRRNANTAVFPYIGGRTLPRKWEDAERWIFSPVARDCAVRTSLQQQQRRPKSKSGPLGSPGVAYYQMFSPVCVDEGGNKVVPNSPFSAGVVTEDGSSFPYGDGESRGKLLICPEPCMARSISIHGCSEMLSSSSVQVLPQDEKCNSTEDAVNNISGGVSRRDMATQMSPASSIRSSSPARLSSFSVATPSTQPIVEQQSIPTSKPGTGDMRIHERVILTRWYRKNRNKSTGSGTRNSDDSKTKAINIHSASWEISTETSKSISKIQREEAKITAWENLQKAKAEAAIRKLEMKLEKKRSSSMDKILNKLRSSEKKAQEMRSSMLTNAATPQISRHSEKALSFRKARENGALTGCFMCHAF